MDFGRLMQSCCAPRLHSDLLNQQFVRDRGAPVTAVKQTKVVPLLEEKSTARDDSASAMVLQDISDDENETKPDENANLG